MGYFTLNKIGAGNPLVDEDALLNDNWDHIDTKLAAMQGIGSYTSPETGQESILNQRFRVWTGSSHINPTDIDAGWSAFTALPILSPILVRTSFTPRWRVNTSLRKVQVYGGLKYNTQTGDPWPRAGYVQVSTDATTNNIPAAYLPIGGTHLQESAASLASTNGALAVNKVELNSGNTAILKLSTRFQGDDGGGNFIMLDKLSWWY